MRDLASFRSKVSKVPPFEGLTKRDAFRSQMKSFGIPVGISEDWDRPNRMREGSVVAGIGSEVLANTDVAQLHVMGYCTFPKLTPLATC